MKCLLFPGRQLLEQLKRSAITFCTWQCNFVATQLFPPSLPSPLWHSLRKFLLASAHQLVGKQSRSPPPLATASPVGKKMQLEVNVEFDLTAKYISCLKSKVSACLQLASFFHFLHASYTWYRLDNHQGQSKREGAQAIVVQRRLACLFVGKFTLWQA